ncbi:hypothetical protein E2C01_086657 [Portunus trituberculatus]|uniref:Uncharacterized protein n=1 Tax=Portunus trituberculatus TaxID=210409 RepID=A0A5B7J1F6_PORTR|nr:hypothetical protein [Portunus trituberculatus]
MNDSHNERVTENIQSKIFVIIEHVHYERITSESGGNPSSSRYERRSRRFEQRACDVDAHCDVMTVCAAWWRGRGSRQTQ